MSCQVLNKAKPKVEQNSYLVPETYSEIFNNQGQLDKRYTDSKLQTKLPPRNYIKASKK